MSEAITTVSIRFFKESMDEQDEHEQEAEALNLMQIELQNKMDELQVPGVDARDILLMIKKILSNMCSLTAQIEFKLSLVKEENNNPFRMQLNNH